jgi:succinate dehydrogenase/fumarate reductase cytochrome b subunit
VEPAAPATRAVGSTLARWFELTSVAPLSAFALLHVASYGRVLFGMEELGAWERPPVANRVAEVLLVWTPLLLHVALAPRVYGQRQPEPHLDASTRASLALHRLSGLVLGVFLVDHFARFRLPILRGERYPAEALGSLAAELSRLTWGVPLVAGLHALGTLAVAFHTSYGLWRVALRYPRLVPPEAARWACAGLGLLLALVGTLTIIRLATG